jgi:hypothetical protein
LFKARPKLFLARVALSVVQKAFGKKANDWGIVQKLQSQVEEKSADASVARTARSAQQSEISAKR